MSPILTYLAARLREPSSLTAIAGLLALVGIKADPGTVSTATTVLAIVLLALGVFVAERGSKAPDLIVADVVDTVLRQLASAKVPAGQSIAKVTPLGIVLLSAGSLVTLVSLAACTPQGELTPRAKAALTTACLVNGVIQPVAVKVLAVTTPEAAGALAIDAALVHPAVQAACAAVGGTPADAPDAAP